MRLFSFPLPAITGTELPSEILGLVSAAPCEPVRTVDVGQAPRDQISDEERERLIRRAGRMMRLSMARYERSGCFSDRGLADYWLLTMQADIRARSPAQVARMEAERGLS
jgi:hypothetical protein